MKKYPVVIIGGGPSGLMCAYTLNKFDVDFLLIESGSKLESRDHNDPIDMTIGIGGAGLYSDGKFSFFPAGEKIWQYDSSQIHLSYNDLKTVMNSVMVGISDIPSKDDYNEYMKNKNLSKNKWFLKKYQVEYLNLELRKKLINSITDDFDSKILFNTDVLNISKHLDVNLDVNLNVNLNTEGDNMYKLDIINSTMNNTSSILASNVILCGGRFFPLFTKKLTFIPHEFKRIELGFRVEGNSDFELFNITTQTDPKFIMSNGSNEFRTFCWCRKGETSNTKFPIYKNNTIIGSELEKIENKYFDKYYISTWSGRSDLIITNKSNFGFNIRFDKEDSVKYLNKALETPSFDLELNQDTIKNIPESYVEIAKLLIDGLKDFVQQNNKLSHIDILNCGLRIKGPTIEGVGYYPISDNSMKVSNENIYVSGDCSGIYRGIVPSMISGSYCAYSYLNNLNNHNNLNKKTIIFLSGKRFSGKSTASDIIKKYYELKNKSVLISSFSLSLKKKFCQINNLCFDEFISNHEFKNKYRNQLTDYFYTTNPIDYIEDIYNLISNLNEDVIIIDDLRLKIHLDWIINKIKLNEFYDLKIIRINSLDKNRELRGWFKTSYDLSNVECELDDYHFDLVINNDFIVENYVDSIYKILNEK